MIDSLYIGATGLQAQQANVNAISNNLANVNTPAYKRARVAFQDMFYREISRAGAADVPQQLRQAVGTGVGILSTSKVFVDGDLVKTDDLMDVAIRGDGFLEVTLPDGSLGYTRGGHLQVTKDRLLASADGSVLHPQITVPADMKSIMIDADGKVHGLPRDGSKPVELGRLELVRFDNPGGLQALSNNLYKANADSGEPLAGEPSQDGFGSLAQGFTEGSNVKLVDEMVSLMVAQRAYEINAKVIQASDELMSMSNNLRR